MAETYRIEKLDRQHRAIIDYFEVARKAHLVRALYEIDVTDIRRDIKLYRKKSGKRLSLTSYLVFLFAQAIGNSPGILKFRKSRSKVVVFDNVDISVLIERRRNNEINLVYYIIRDANLKSFQEIHDEIEAAQKDHSDSVFAEGQSRRIGSLVALLPGFLRRVLIAYVLKRNPMLRKKAFGLVSYSSISGFGVSRGWGLSLSPHLLNMVSGGMGRLPRMVDGKLRERDLLSMTLSLDHDFLDGAPAARFLYHFQDLSIKRPGISDYLKQG